MTKTVNIEINTVIKPEVAEMWNATGNLLHTTPAAIRTSLDKAVAVLEKAECPYTIETAYDWVVDAVCPIIYYRMSQESPNTVIGCNPCLQTSVEALEHFVREYWLKG